MLAELVMPQLGSDMKEGTLTRWLKQEGDPVTKGEPIAEVETDKALVEIEADAAGALRKALVSAEATVAVGQVIGLIGVETDAVPERGNPVPLPPAALPLTVPANPVASPAPAPWQDRQPTNAGWPVTAAPHGRLRVSPLAHREASSRGVDLSRVQGTGQNGRITRDDVRRFADRKSQAEPVGPRDVDVDANRFHDGPVEPSGLRDRLVPPHSYAIGYRARDDEE